MRVTFHGQKELEEALRQLPKELSGRAGGPVKLALKDAAQPVFEDQLAQAAIHADTGDLMASLKVMRHPNPRITELFGVGVSRMGKRPGKGQPQRTGLPWYADIVEYGGRGKTGPLKGMIRQSMEKNRTKSEKIYTTRLAVGIEKIARKIGNENARKVAAAARKPQRTSVQKLFDYRPPG